jgi:hypothetical protein
VTSMARHSRPLDLTAPEVAGSNGDGLLTVEEIIALINMPIGSFFRRATAAGAGAGAEVVSGLGRAFF